MTIKLPQFPRFGSKKPKDDNNLDAELEPFETTNPELKQTEREDDIVNWVHEQFKSSASMRRLMEQRWLLATAYENDNQWVEYKAGIGMRNLQDENDPARSYVTANLIRPTKNKVKARATMNKPDASVFPESDRVEDVAATPECRDVIDHYDRKFKRQQQTRLWADTVLITSTGFLKIAWDPNARAAVPAIIQDENGNGSNVRHQMAMVGDIVEDVVPCWEIFPDPRARSWEQCKWIIHAKRQPLSYFEETYERGKWVKSDATSTYEYMETRLDWVLDNNSRIPANDKTALLLEMWQLPTPRYPRGRRIDVAGNVLLEYKNELPYDFCIEQDRLPFVPLQYETRFGSLWSPNLVDRLIKLQYYLNVNLSRIQDRVNNDRMVMLIPEGAEISTDAYESVRMMIKVYYKNAEVIGGKPEYQPAPPMNAEVFKLIEIYKGLMEDIAGVHEVSNGQVPSGVTAGNAIELLQQSDTTQMSEFTGNIEQAQVERAEWEIALASQFFKEERLLSVSTEGNPNKAMQTVRAFEGLRAGGRVRVSVTPGSATPKTPAARIQQYMDMMKAGMFAPQALPVLRMLVKLMELERADVFEEHLDDVIAEVQAMQPSPAAVEQQKAQSAQQQQQMQQQAMAEQAAIKSHAEIEVENAKNKNRIDLEFAKAEAHARADAQLSEHNHAQNLEIQQSDHHHDAAMHHIQTITPKATMSIPVKLGPKAIRSAEEMLGLDIDDPADLMPQLKPTKPGKDIDSNGKAKAKDTQTS